MKPGAYPDPRSGNPPLSVEEYDAIPALRSSVLRVFAQRTPRHARWMMEHPTRETHDTFLGTLLHMAILEPDRFEREVLVQPYFGHHAANATKALKAQWIAEHPGAIAIKEEELESLKAWRTELFSVPVIRHLLTCPGINELSLIWDEPCGVRCKARLDRFVEYTGKGTKVELKTARNGDGWRFGRQALDLGYHIQDAFYMRGLDTIYGKRERRSVICTLEKGDEHSPSLAVPYEFEAAAKHLGSTIVERAISDYAECEKAGVWPGYSIDIEKLQLPSYAFKRSGSDELGGDWELGV